MKILITGVQNSVEESIVKLAVERIEGKAKFRTLSFSDFIDNSSTPKEELDLLKNTQEKIRDSIQLKLIGEKTGNVIVNGYFTVGTKLGIFPVINDETVKVFKPDLIIHINVNPLALGDKLEDEDAFRDQQDVEKTYALMIAAKAGCSVKIVHCGIEGSRDAADEIFKLLKALLVI
ncbi:MAG: AAA family ATPase [Candidatus Aenigmarchaeota archaeon]|nr:AAA family ATPase [Candidatus Aenigmarchaeota archaeon]